MAPLDDDRVLVHHKVAEQLAVHNHEVVHVVVHVADHAAAHVEDHEEVRVEDREVVREEDLVVPEDHQGAVLDADEVGLAERMLDSRVVLARLEVLAVVPAVGLRALVGVHLDLATFCSSHHP